MKESIVEKLSVLSRREKLWTETEVFYFLGQSRKLLEKENVGAKYPLIKFYADWALHTEKTQQFTGPIKDVMREINKTVGSIYDEIAITSLEPHLKFIKMIDLRKEIVAFAAQFQIGRLFEAANDWKSFANSALEILRDQPMKEPISEIREFCVKGRMEEKIMWNIVFSDKRGDWTLVSDIQLDVEPIIRPRGT